MQELIQSPISYAVRNIQNICIELFFSYRKFTNPEITNLQLTCFSFMQPSFKIITASLQMLKMLKLKEIINNIIFSTQSRCSIESIELVKQNTM